MCSKTVVEAFTARYGWVTFVDTWFPKLMLFEEVAFLLVNFIDVPSTCRAIADGNPCPLVVISNRSTTTAPPTKNGNEAIIADLCRHYRSYRVFCDDSIVRFDARCVCGVECAPDCYLFPMSLVPSSA